MKSASRYILTIISVIFLLAVVLVALANFGMLPSSLERMVKRLGLINPRKVIVGWTDPELDVIASVYQDKTDRGNILGMCVIAAGRKIERQLAENISMRTVRLVRYKNWLLVANGKYVLGGYNLITGVLYGQGQWNKLPFTIYKGQGRVVGSMTVQVGPADKPAGFPEKLNTSTAPVK